MRGVERPAELGWPEPEYPAGDFEAGARATLRILASGVPGVQQGILSAEGMLGKAREKGIYRTLATADLSKPLTIPAGVYANAAQALAQGIMARAGPVPVLLRDGLADILTEA